MWIKPNESETITSLMYPLYAPRKFSQEVTVETAIGYIVLLKTIEVDIPEDVNCTDNHLEIIDQSLTNESINILERFTCSKDSGKSKFLLQEINNLRTYLNVMKLQLKSLTGSNQTILFKATVSSEIGRYCCLLFVLFWKPNPVR